MIRIGRDPTNLDFQHKPHIDDVALDHALRLHLPPLQTPTTNGAIMISKFSGDILLSKAQAIAHGIAPRDHFNQGLALALRECFPAMAKDFRDYCHLQSPKAGLAWLWPGRRRCSSI